MGKHIPGDSDSDKSTWHAAAIAIKARNDARIGVDPYALGSASHVDRLTVQALSLQCADLLAAAETIAVEENIISGTYEENDQTADGEPIYLRILAADWRALRAAIAAARGEA